MTPQAAQQTLRVLLIEDNTADADRIQEWLAEENAAFEIFRAETLKDGLALAQRQKPDILLLDLFLPDSGGEETFHAAQAHFPETPIIIFSGLRDEKKALEMVRAGAEDYLIKDSITQNLLVRVLRYALERHRARLQLQDLALLDDLTGLYNRRGFLKLGEHQMLLAKRQNQGLSLFLFDLDRFKQINDRFGHAAGDEMLRRMAQALKASFRTSDITARIGGDEFAVMAMGVLPPAAIAAIRQKIIKNLAPAQEPVPQDAVSASVGAAFFDPRRPQSLEAWLKEADAALYRDKESRE